jgi:uncharacterized protein RhaS with RHS repeats
VGAPFRFYQVSAGRWLNRDPIAERGGINLYAYCANSPTSNADSLGLTAFSPSFIGPLRECDYYYDSLEEKMDRFGNGDGYIQDSEIGRWYDPNPGLSDNTLDFILPL